MRGSSVTFTVWVTADWREASPPSSSSHHFTPALAVPLEVTATCNVNSTGDGLNRSDRSRPSHQALVSSSATRRSQSPTAPPPAGPPPAHCSAYRFLLEATAPRRRA